MLVMSRRRDEEIVFPHVGVTVKVLRVDGSRVRLGVQAPDDIDVYRREVLDSGRLKERGDKQGDASDHAFRNELNAVHLAVEMYQRQLERGETDKAHQTFLKMISRLKEVDLRYAAPNAAAQEAEQDGPRILIVEDDDNERELLAGLLQMDGCRVRCAADGVEALDQLHSDDRPDMVLLDMNMPRVDGAKTLSVIRDTPSLKNLLVFAVSGSDPRTYGIEVGQESGVDDWFQKPLNPGSLVQRMRERMAARTSAASL
jgi:carbon storage regulator CsrA